MKYLKLFSTCLNYPKDLEELEKKIRKEVEDGAKTHQGLDVLDYRISLTSTPIGNEYAQTEIVVGVIYTRK